VTTTTDVLGEIRAAYARLGIELDTPVAYGTYYRLRCAGCGAVVGNVGDRLLPGMIDQLLDESFDLHAAGLLGCRCGHQAARAASLDSGRAAGARARLA
jgi:hypothetical protein